MLQIFRDFKKTRELNKTLKEFHEEIKGNLESYYVMFQLGSLKSFRLESWRKVKDNPDIHIDDKVCSYAAVIEDYQKNLADFSDFEKWYTSDINHKTQENARVLHAKREEAQKKFQGLEDVIQSALKELEYQFLDKITVKK